MTTPEAGSGADQSLQTAAAVRDLLASRQPDEIFNWMEERRDAGDIPEFLIGVDVLDQRGAVEVPELREFLRDLGKEPKVWEGAFNALTQAEDKGNVEEIQRGLRVAELLGIEEVPEVAGYIGDLRTKYSQPAAAQVAPEVPEPEDGEMVRLQDEVLATAKELAGRKGVDPDGVLRAHLPAEARVPAEDLSMLSLSQLRERAAFLTPDQLSQIPPFKLSELIMGGNLTVRQVANLPEDPEAGRLLDHYSQAALARYDIRAVLDEDIKTGKIPLKDLPRMALAALRVGYRAAAKGFPSQLNETVVPAAVREGMTTLARQWQDYDKRRGRFLIGGLAGTARPPAVSKDEIARVGRLLVDVGFTAMATYEYQIKADKLLARENTLAERDSLELRPDELESLERNISKDPESFPLLAEYVRGLKEAEAAKPPAAAQETPAEQSTLGNLFAQLRALFQEAKARRVGPLESQTRPIIQALESQIADGLRPELTAVALDLRNEKEIGRLLENKDWGIANAVRELRNPDFAQRLFPDSPELQASYQALVWTAGTGRDLQNFLEVVSRQVGWDREQMFRLVTVTSAWSRDFHERLLDPAVPAADLANVYVEYQKAALADRRSRNEYIQRTFGFLVAAIQKAGLPLHPSVNTAIQELKDAGMKIPYLEPEASASPKQDIPDWLEGPDTESSESVNEAMDGELAGEFQRIAGETDITPERLEELRQRYLEEKRAREEK